ncbi:MAG: alpha/beta fold hydrolase [Nitrospirales bacterium]
MLAMVETILTFADAEGHQVSAILAEPVEKTERAVILCHGFLSNKNSKTNRRLTDLLVPVGFSTLRFDWLGLGETEGDFADITIGLCWNQLECALDFLQAKGYHHLGVIGSSFGGLIAILAAARNPTFSAIGLKCPVPDFPETLRLELGEEGMNRWKQTDTIPNVTGGTEPVSLRFAFYEDCCRYDVFKAAASIQTPTVITHGDQDKLVPLHQIHRLAQAIPGEKQVHILPGADHHFAKPEDFRKMTALLAGWMRTHVAPEEEVTFETETPKPWKPQPEFAKNNLKY